MVATVVVLVVVEVMSIVVGLTAKFSGHSKLATEEVPFT